MDSPRSPRSLSRSWTPYAVLASLLLVATAIASFMIANARGKEQARFEASANRVTEIIKTRIETDFAAAATAVGLYAASKGVDITAFHDFVAAIDVRRRYPGMQGIGFSARVRDKEALIKSMRDQGVPDFKLWPEHDRPERYAVTSMEPSDSKNKTILGLDMSTDPVLHAAMDRARDTGLPSVSGRVLLAAEPGRAPQPGLVLFAPVYQNGAPHANEAERRASLEGFVVCPFLAEELFESVFTAGADLDVDYELFDNATLIPASRLYSSLLDRPTHEKPRGHYETTITAAGHTWSLVFRPRAESRWAL